MAPTPRHLLVNHRKFHCSLYFYPSTPLDQGNQVYSWLQNEVLPYLMLQSGGKSKAMTYMTLYKVIRSYKNQIQLTYQRMSPGVENKKLRYELRHVQSHE